MKSLWWFVQNSTVKILQMVNLLPWSCTGDYMVDCLYGRLDSANSNVIEKATACSRNSDCHSNVNDDVHVTATLKYSYSRKFLGKSLSLVAIAWTVGKLFTIFERGASNAPPPRRSENGLKHALRPRAREYHCLLYLISTAKPVIS